MTSVYPPVYHQNLTTHDGGVSTFSSSALRPVMFASGVAALYTKRRHYNVCPSFRLYLYTY